MFTIARRFAFSASHRLLDLPLDHKCSRHHGHNYTVWLELETKNLRRGMVVDFSELGLFKQWLDAEFDHRHLNDVVDFSPTCEALAWFFFNEAKEIWPELVAVRVSEGEATWAEYRP